MLIISVQEKIYCKTISQTLLYLRYLYKQKVPNIFQARLVCKMSTKSHLYVNANMVGWVLNELVSHMTTWNLWVFVITFSSSLSTALSVSWKQSSNDWHFKQEIIPQYKSYLGYNIEQGAFHVLKNKGI